MATITKRLGDLIREVDARNRDDALCAKDLRGISVTKQFITTHANLVGVSFSNYKIVKPNQFAYIPDTSRRGDKIAISINKTDKDIIVSTICTVFEIVNADQLLPQYLMLWFERPEFDRFARFKSHGSAREVFSWEDISNVKIPVPDIEIQKTIIKQHLIAEKRIDILQRINSKLEDLAYSYYRRLVDKEPEQSLSISCDTILGGTPSRDKSEYWGGNIGWINSGEINNFRVMKASEYITELALKKSATKIMPSGTTVLAITGATLGQYSRLCGDYCANQSVIGILPKNSSNISNEFIYLSVRKNLKNLLSGQTGGAQPHINSNDVKNLQIPVSTPEIEKEIQHIILPLFNLIELNCREIVALKSLNNLSSLQTNYRGKE